MRKTDTERKQHFRVADRFTQEGGQWFFDTREGQRGPFATRKAAELELQRFIDTMEFLEDRKDSLPSDVNWSDVTVVDIDETPSCY